MKNILIYLLVLTACFYAGYEFSKRRFQTQKTVYDTIEKTVLDTVFKSKIIYKKKVVFQNQKIDTAQILENYFTKKKEVKILKTKDLNANFEVLTYENKTQIQNFKYQILRPTKIIKSSGGFYFGGFAGRNLGGAFAIYHRSKLSFSLGYDLINSNFQLGIAYKIF